MFYEPITPHDDFAGRVEARPDPQAPPSALVMVLARALRGLRDQRRGEPGDSTAVLVAVIVVRGPYAPAEVGRLVLARLEEDGRLAPDTYRAWVEAGGGYQMVKLPDESEWVLRQGEEGRYVHLHPGRWVPQTRRVRANVLKTAVLALAWVGVHGGDPLDLAVLNRVRRQYLGLAPLGRLLPEQGLGEVIALLGGA